MAKSTKKKPSALSSVELLKRCGLGLELAMLGVDSTPSSASTKRGPAAVPKKAATPDSDGKATKITLPESVERVLVDLQGRLFEINAIIACIHAQAEAKACDGDVRWALEAVLTLFRPIIDEVDGRAIAKAVAKWEEQ